MINDKYIVVFDMETTGKSPITSEITQVAAQVIHPRKLEIIDSFNSEVRPLNMDGVEDEALRVTRKTKEKLALAPHPKTVWENFTTFIHQYNPKKTAYNSPIGAGFNTDAYDMTILRRYCKEYGPWDEKRDQQSLLSEYMSFDLLKHFFWLFESNVELQDNKLTTILEYMGMDTNEAHDAMVDVNNTSKVLIRLLKMYRNVASKAKFKGAFASESK